MTVKITWNNPTDWAVKKTPAAGPARRAALAAPPDFPPQFLAGPVTVAAAFDATPRVSPRRAAACPVVDVTVEAGPNESCVLALRHPEDGAPCEAARSRTPCLAHRS